MYIHIRIYIYTHTHTHIHSALEPVLGRIGKEVQRIRLRTTDNHDEIAKITTELESRPVEFLKSHFYAQCA